MQLTTDLRPLLTYPDSQVMVSAAHVVGNMVKVAGANLPDSFFTKEVGQALQIMDGASACFTRLTSDSRQEVNRFSAVLLLHQFAVHDPLHFHPFVLRVLEKIWVPLRDSRVSVFLRCRLTSDNGARTRVDAAECVLGHCEDPRTIKRRGLPHDL